MANRKTIKKSLRKPDHQRLIKLLVDARSKAGMTQHAVADRLDKPQSFVAKYEGSERRLDLIEFIAICVVLDTDPARAVREIAGKSKK